MERQASAAAAAAEAARVETARQVAALTDQAHTASARAQEIEKRAEDLKGALALAQASEQRVSAELETERKQHEFVREKLAAATTEVVTVKARAEAQGQVQLEQAERLKRVEAELTQARAASAAAREEAAKLAGQAEALTAQHAELMRVIQDRDGEHPAPRGGKR